MIAEALERKTGENIGPISIRDCRNLLDKGNSI